jgi:hypothetical protein
MAGRPQGGGAPQQMQNQMQGMRQGMAGMPSQYPGANMAAPGGMTKPAVMPQGFMDAPNGPGGMQQGMTKPAVMPQGMARPMPMPGPGGASGMFPVIPLEEQPAMPQGQGLINPDPAQVQAMFQQAQAQQGMNVGAYQPQISQPLPPAAPQPQISQPLPPAAPQPQMSQPLPQAQPMPRPMPRPMPQGRPQIMGNPTAMPLQRSQFKGRR